MIQKEIRFAIIGCGKIAPRHAQQIIKIGKLVGVCDIVKERADKIAAEFNTNAYYNIDELLKTEADVIVICTPNGLHSNQTIQSLNAGFHVICEKPMALTTKDCREMIKASELNNKKLFIVKQNRYNPPVVAVKKLAGDGKLGKIHSIQLNCFWNREAEYYKDSWKGTREMDGGILFTQFSHFIDLMYWFMGDVAEVKSFTGNFQHKNIIEFEDAGVAILKFANNAIGTINYTINSFQKNMEGSITLFGEKGTVKIGGEYLNTLEYQSVENSTPIKPEPGNAANSYGTYLGSMSNHDKVYKNVVEVLNGKSSITTNPFEAMKTVEIINLIMNSSEKFND